MSKHTPGPWHLEDAGESDRGKMVSIDSGPLRIIARPDWHGDHEEYMANALLISVAPELLVALQECHAFIRSLLNATADEVVDFITNNGESVEDVAFDAIAKAEGRE